MKSISMRLRFATIIGILTIALPVISVSTCAQVAFAHATGGSFTRLIPSGGTAAFGPTSSGIEGLQFPEIRSQPSNDAGPAPFTGTIDRRSGKSDRMARGNPELEKSFNGITQREHRLASNGNQFTFEPPDQGLCVGGGFVMESVNAALRVYDTAGSPLTPVTATNAFYGYPPARVIGPPTVSGPFAIDPSCYYDKPTQRWFQIVLTLDVDPKTGQFLGSNHLDLAVSKTSNPTGAWTIYRIPVQDNGTQGTPNHGCSMGFCLGDYPHIGADKNGFYITINEYSFSGSEFHAAQIYAFSKAALASGAVTVAVTQLDTFGTVGTARNPGFTVWPATTPGDGYANTQGGIEYFMSSNAAQEAKGNGASSDLIVWALTNTQSLNSTNPTLNLSNIILTVSPYAIPPKSEQKQGSVPFAECLNTPSCSATLIGGVDLFHEVEGPLDSNDTRMQQVVYAGGLLSGALDTTLTVDGVNQAGIEWFFVKPHVSAIGVSGSVVNNGYLGLALNNVIYPAIGMTEDGKGIMAFTLVGQDFYPSAAYSPIDAQQGVGDIHVAALGKGPQDGFSEYKLFGNPPGSARPRWGDFGAAVGVGNSVWIASEYIGQRCSVAQYEATPFGSCNSTRTALANWFTRISQVGVG